MKKINNENVDPLKKPEVYYFKDGLFIEIPKSLNSMNPTTEIFQNDIKNQGKKHLAMNLLNDYHLKKEKDKKFKKKLSEKNKNVIDNIMIRTERFLMERQEKINNLTVERLAKEGSFTYRPTINHYSKKLSRNLSNLFRSNNNNKNNSFERKDSLKPHNIQNYYIKKPAKSNNNSTSNPLHYSNNSSLKINSSQLIHKLKHSKSNENITISLNQKSKPISKSIYYIENLKSSKNFKNNQSNSVKRLENDLINEISAINDRIEDLIKDPSNIIPSNFKVSLQELNSQQKNNELKSNKLYLNEKLLKNHEKQKNTSKIQRSNKLKWESNNEIREPRAFEKKSNSKEKRLKISSTSPFQQKIIKNSNNRFEVNPQIYHEDDKMISKCDADENIQININNRLYHKTLMDYKDKDNLNPEMHKNIIINHENQLFLKPQAEFKSQFDLKKYNETKSHDSHPILMKPINVFQNAQIPQPKQHHQKNIINEVNSSNQLNLSKFQSTTNPQLNINNKLTINIESQNEDIEEEIEINRKDNKNLKPPIIKIPNLLKEINKQSNVNQINSIHKNFNHYNNQDLIPPPEETIPTTDRMQVFAQWLDLSVYERNNLWAQNKTQRLENKKYATKRYIMQECTFKPQTSNSNSGVSPEKYGTFDIRHMKNVFREVKGKVFNSYSSQRTLKTHYNSVNKPIN